MLQYRILDGHFSINGVFQGTGYSGAGLSFAEGRNNPAKVAIENVGPIPPGKYRVEPPRNSRHLGPVVFDLTPMPETEVYGRSLFRIHGNDKENNASHGCIILGPAIRDHIASLFALHELNDENWNVLEVIV